MLLLTYLVLCISLRERLVTRSLWSGNSYIKMYYVGLNISDSANMMGRNPVRFVFPIEQIHPHLRPNHDITVTLLISGNTINNNSLQRHCVFFYEDRNGRRIADGSGEVFISDPKEYPSFDLYKIDSAKFFNGEGTLISCITNGAGQEIVYGQNNNIILRSNYMEGFWVDTRYYDVTGEVSDHIIFDPNLHVDYKKL